MSLQTSWVLLHWPSFSIPKLMVVSWILLLILSLLHMLLKTDVMFQCGLERRKTENKAGPVGFGKLRLESSLRS